MTNATSPLYYALTIDVYYNSGRRPKGTVGQHFTSDVPIAQKGKEKEKTGDVQLDRHKHTWLDLWKAQRAEALCTTTPILCPPTLPLLPPRLSQNHPEVHAS